jgi:hypothetical protein
VATARDRAGGRATTQAVIRLHAPNPRGVS